VELAARLPDLAGGASQPSSGAEGGPGQRERAHGGALLLSVGEPLAMLSGGELDELVHGRPSLFPVMANWLLWSTVTDRGGQSPYVAAHRTGTGLGWVVGPGAGAGERAGLAPGGGGAGSVADEPVAEQAGLGFGGLLRRLRYEAGLTQASWPRPRR